MEDRQGVEGNTTEGGKEEWVMGNEYNGSTEESVQTLTSPRPELHHKVTLYHHTSHYW